MRLLFGTVSVAALALSGCQNASAPASRDQIRVVGSSTVFPFAQAMVEQFTQTNAGMKAPIVESTGTGAGIKLFCAGIGSEFPDIATASRRLKKSEFEMCKSNGVSDIAEVQIGLDGLAFAESQRGPGLKLTTKLVYEALAANPYGKGPNKARTWADLDPSLPAVAISVMGPPSTSGTRDSLAELVLTAGCDSDPAMKALKTSDEKKHKQLCTQVREDGAYVDAGENDNLIVRKLEANPQSVGVFGFSYLDANRDKLRDVPLNGVEAVYESVANGSYPGARPLYLYVKKGHLQAVPGIKAYIETFAKHWAPGGVLAKRGMVAAPEAVRSANAQVASGLPSLDGGALK